MSREAEAAKDIKELIGTSAGQVQHGVQLVGRAGEALDRIARRIGEMSALIDGIANASQSQATGITEVNTAVHAMDRATQQNAAMVEQSTAAATSLLSEASRLASLVDRFSLGQGAGAGAVHRATRLAA